MVNLIHITDCDKLVIEGKNAAKHSLNIAADIFGDAAKCFDRSGEREKAAQYLTLAGDFLLESGEEEKAASWYGKAILRYLMSDKIEIAETLIEKGKSFGFTTATHHYRIALDAMDRRKPPSKSEGLKEKEKEKDKTITDRDLPEIDLLPLEMEDDLILFNSDDLGMEEDVLLTKKNFKVPQLELEKDSSINMYEVLAAVSKATRERTQNIIETNAVVKDFTGESRIIEPRFSLKTTDDSLNKDSNAISLLDEINEEIDLSADLKSSDTLDLDYIAKTDLKNEFEQELMDLEIVNTIPFQWQVINVKSDFNLNERKATEDGLVYTWKTAKLEPGQSKSVEYILRKRIERSIILRKGQEVSVLSFYYSIDQNLTTELNFVNTSGEVFREILIEDVVPPELIVYQIDTVKQIKPMTTPTHDSTLFRWMFRTLTPGDNFLVKYSFKEKPLTRHYIDEIEYNNEIIKIEKISQPVIDSTNYEFIWFYEFNNPFKDAIVFIDRIPTDVEIILVEPPHLRPSLSSEKTHLVLKWEIAETKEPIHVVVRLLSKESFTPLAPSIELEHRTLHLLERNSTSEKKTIDLRKTREKSKERA